MKPFSSLIIAISIILISTKSWSNDGNGFNHPGLFHSQNDLDRMREAVKAKEEPIFSGFKILKESLHSKSNYKMQGPFPEWGRAPNIRAGEARNDAKAAYENALMWSITGDKEHAKKAIQIINAWANTLKKVSGIDGVLAAGIQGVKFANAAEILRYSNSGWSEQEAKKCEESFKKAWYPTIQHYAYFANGNWETAALQTNMAIAVFCNDRELFESTVKYSVNGAGNGSIPHMIVYPSGQCQETTRAQHYAQLGIGLLTGAAEIAWNQGVDLYGWNDNRILKGFEYTAKYGLGEEVPFENYLDRTGKYGLGGRHQNYTEISTVSRGRFWPIFERIQNHYTNRRNIYAPYSSKVVKIKRPEGHSSDYVGHGTLTHWRNPIKATKPVLSPGVPSGLINQNLNDGIKITWIKSVDPVTSIDAESYQISRSAKAGGPYELIAKNISNTFFLDKNVTQGKTYHYKVKAINEVGASQSSSEFSACAGLPPSWEQGDIGKVKVPGYSLFDGKKFTLDGEGHDINGKSDSFHFAYKAIEGDCTIIARVIRPMSSQWTKPGVMIRKSLTHNSAHASALLLPHWNGALVTRSTDGGETKTLGSTHLGESHIIKKNRLSTPYWLKISKYGTTVIGYMSPDGDVWQKLAEADIDLGNNYFVGLPACSQLDKVTTRVTYDRVEILQNN
tara:strand:+ start:267 stop:2291 length:2025 start_codon:yes stop_codon:yes gene_type:complete